MSIYPQLMFGQGGNGRLQDSGTPRTHGLTDSTRLQWTPEHRNPTDSTDSTGLQWTARDSNGLQNTEILRTLRTQQDSNGLHETPMDSSRLRKNLESVESVDFVESWSMPFSPCVWVYFQS
jgi:hypothetical protein